MSVVPLATVIFLVSLSRSLWYAFAYFLFVAVLLVTIDIIFLRGVRRILLRQSVDRHDTFLFRWFWRIDLCKSFFEFIIVIVLLWNSPVVMKRHVDVALTSAMIRLRLDQHRDICLLPITVLSMIHWVVSVVQSRTMVNLIDCLLLVVLYLLLSLSQPGERLTLFFFSRFGMSEICSALVRGNWLLIQLIIALSNGTCDFREPCFYSFSVR